MKHIVRVFDIKTEEFLEAIEIPAYRKNELFDLMGWQDPEDEIYCYNLSAQQLKVLEEWTNREICSPDRLAVLAGYSD